MRKVIKVRLENVRGDTVYWADLVVDGVKLLATYGSTNTTTSATSIFERHGHRMASHDAAVASLEALLAGRASTYASRTRSEEELPPSDEEVSPAALCADLETELVTARHEATPQVAAASASVYADWLQTQGDIRGELAAMFLAHRDGEARDWIAANQGKLFGKLDIKLDSEILELEWLDGFLAGVTLAKQSIDSMTKLPALTTEFLALPVARVVSSLRFGLASYESDNDWTETMAAVIASPQAAGLRALRFDAYSSDECEISWTGYGDFSKAWPALPNLETLVIRAGVAGTCGEIVLPKLRTFARKSGGLAAAELDEILAAKWPELESLEIWFGRDTYGGNCKIEQLAPLFDGRIRLPKLKRLALMNAEFTQEMIEPLAKSKLLPQLARLDLSMGVLMDEDVDLLVKHADAFRHLEVLELAENLLAERTSEVATALPNARIGYQRDDDGRYAGLGE